MTAALFNSRKLLETQDWSGVVNARGKDHGLADSPEHCSKTWYLLVQVDDTTKCYEFAPLTERVVTVGTDTEADVHLTGSKLGSLAFYLERRDDDIWLVPAYLNHALRANAARVVAPRRLNNNNLIECGSLLLVVGWTLTPPTHLVREPNKRPPNDSIPKRVYLNRLPRPDEATQLPWRRDEASEACVEESATVALQDDNSSCLGFGQSDPIRNVRSLKQTLSGLAPGNACHRVVLTPRSPENRPNFGGSFTQHDLARPARTPCNIEDNTRTEPAHCDWLYRVGRSAKYRPFRTQLLAILLALFGSALVVMVAELCIRCLNH